MSLTCILCKIYEKILREHILQHAQGEFSLFQHGFISWGKSFLSDLFETVEQKLHVYLDNGHEVISFI